MAVGLQGLRNHRSMCHWQRTNGRSAPTESAQGSNLTTMKGTGAHVAAVAATGDHVEAIDEPDQNLT